MKSKIIQYLLIAILCGSIFFTFTPFSRGAQKNPRTSQGHIFDGLWLNYTYDSGIPLNSTFNYNFESGTLYNVTWTNKGYVEYPSFSWLEDTQTRLTSNSTGAFGDGVHTPIWIFTNLTIGNSTTIVVGSDFDHAYTVTGELEVNYPGFGTFNVWVLEDDIYSNQAWYEQNTGFLINGTFQWSGGMYIFNLTATNLFPKPEGRGGEIPSYEIYLVLPFMGITSFFILKKRLRTLRT